MVQASPCGPLLIRSHPSLLLRRTALAGLRELVVPMAGHSHGKPPMFKDVMEKFPGKGAALLHPNSKVEVFLSNSALYFFCSELARAGFQKLLEELVPSDFGYNAINDEQIGPSRAARAEQTAVLEARMNDLLREKQSLVDQLSQFGVSVARGWLQ